MLQGPKGCSLAPKGSKCEATLAESRDGVLGRGSEGSEECFNSQWGLGKATTTNAFWSIQSAENSSGARRYCEMRRYSFPQSQLGRKLRPLHPPPPVDAPGHYDRFVTYIADCKCYNVTSVVQRSL